MRRTKYTPDQITALSNNPNVIRCNEGTIIYSKDFKIAAVRQRLENGLTPKQIFEEAGFDLDIIGEYIPEERLQLWKNIYQTKGPEGLLSETRGKGGGRPRKQWSSDVERVKYLEAQVAYLKAENDFLAKLRAKRAE